MDPTRQPQQPVPDQGQPPAPQPVVEEAQSYAPQVPQPVAPVQPIAVPGPVLGGQPVGFGGVAVPPQPAPAGGSNKKLIILIVSLVVGLLLIGGIVLILIAVFTVSRKDYSAALSQYNEVASANYTLNSKLSTLQYSVDSTTDTSFDNDVEAAKKAIQQVRDENAELAKLKAVSLGEGNTKYKAFAAKLDAYLTYSNNLLTSLDTMRDAAITCDESGTTSSSSAGEIKSAIDDCVAALEKVSNVADSDVKEFVGKIKDEYTSLSGVIGQIAAITDPYGDQYDQYKSLRDQMYDIQDNISNAQTDFRSNLEKHSDAVDPKESAEDLSKFLESKLSS